MNIGYDAKRIFHNATGLGNYGRDIVRILTGTSRFQHFYLFNTKKSDMENEVALQKATIVYPKGWFWRTFPTLWRLFGQWRQICEQPIDIFHGLSGELPIQFGSKRIPKVVTIHDLIFLSHPQFYNFFDRIIYKLKFQYAVTHADRIIAISQQTKRDLVHYLKADQNKISVIYQGCNEVYKKMYSPSEKDAIRKKFNLPDNFILNVGTIQARKNVLAVVKAIQGTDFHLVLVGQEKGYAQKVHDYIDQNKMERQVTFIKNITSADLAKLYQSATVFCYPSLCEGFGIPIIEALYSKLPVITTRGGCFPEAAGPDSIFIDPHNIPDIRRAVEELYSDPGQREHMAEKGYQYVQRFSDARVADHLTQLYKSLT